MKLSVSAYRAHASAHKKILSSGYHSQLNYGSTGAGAASVAAAAVAAAGTNTSSTSSFGGLYEQSAQCGIADDTEIILQKKMQKSTDHSNTDTIIISPTGTNSSTQDGTFNSQRQHLEDFDDNSQSVSSQTKSPSQRLTYCTERDRLLLPSRDKTVNFAYEQQDHHHHQRQLQQENDSHKRKLHMTHKAHTHGKAFIKSPTLDCIKERTYQTNLVQCTSLSTSAVNESFNELLTPNRGLSWTRRHSLNALTDIFQPTQQRPTDIRLNARAGVGVGVGVGTQKWKNLKAVMAYYCSLKRIKRNVNYFKQ